jgi:hypothetical protein
MMCYSMNDFYKNLPSFSRFSQAVEESHYFDLPDDWLILITDVKGSTQAIDAGKYKDVNTLGATAIIGVINSIPNVEIPYVFGGDGATFAFPKQFEVQVKESLCMARWLAQNEFQLDLRVDIYSIQEMRQNENFTFKVAKLKLGESVRLAMFRGDGFQKAEDRLKNPLFENEILEKFKPIRPDASRFSGLECRWNSLTPKRGQVVSLIVLARSRDQQRQKIYTSILQWIETNLSGDDSIPVSLASLPVSWPPKDLYAEIKVRTASFGPFKKAIYKYKALFTSLLAMILIKYKINLGPFKPDQYLSQLISQSDHRKFENSLKMILDCSVKDADKMGTFLNQLYKDEEIFFGLHLSPKAIMTCMVFSLENHLHLIDGSDGGYTLAAKQLKEQIKNHG